MLTIYSTSSCVQCTATKRFLKAKGINYVEFNTEEDEQAASVAKGLGYLQAPVVVPDFNFQLSLPHWSGYRPDMLGELEKAMKAEGYLQQQTA